VFGLTKEIPGEGLAILIGKVACTREQEAEDVHAHTAEGALGVFIRRIHQSIGCGDGGDVAGI
jgi:hypothetical protein